MVIIDLHSQKHSNLLTSLGAKAVLFSGFLSILGGRWISYFGLPSKNIFLIDVLFLSGALICRFSCRIISKKIFLLEFLFLIFIISQLFRNSELSLVVKLRDLLPFIYLGLSPGIIIALSRFRLKKIIRVLRVATSLHFLWAIPGALNLIPTITVPGFGVPIFSNRQDLSGFTMSFGIILWNKWPNLNLKSNNIMILIMFTGTLFLGSRAGLLATIFATICVIFSQLHTNDNKESKKKINIFFILFILTSLLIFIVYSKNLPQESSIRRLGITSANSSVSEQAHATANGRAIAQKIGRAHV